MAFFYRPECVSTTVEWAHDFMVRRYSEALHRLSHNETSFHFNILHAEPWQIQEFRLEDVAARIWKKEPLLWSIIYRLVTGDVTGDNEEPLAATSGEDSEEPEDLEADDEEGDAEDEGFAWRRDKSRKSRAFHEIVSKTRYRDEIIQLTTGTTPKKTATILSQLAHARNKNCNALQSVVGIFLHSSNTPEKVVKVLARMGISVSLTSIHRAIHALKITCLDDIRALGRTLLAAYAFDNFDVKFSTGIPTIDGIKELLVHLTSGTLLRLEHITLDHLRFGDHVWQSSPFNRHATNYTEFVPLKTLGLLYGLHAETDHDVQASGLTRRGQFRAYLFKKTLFSYGPKYFKDLRDSLSHPDPIERIPVRKTVQVPLRAMDINQSRVSGNIDALLQMLEQAGVGDSEIIQSAEDEMTDIGNVVQLVHGDLGTMERVLTAMERRGIDLTPAQRLQFVVFVFGLFHLKMAAADAIWRLMVAPTAARKDPGSFWAIVEKLRPTRTGKLMNNATFREQHELIGHVGEVLRLDAWRVELRRNGYLTLEKWAEEQPSLEDIDRFAQHLASTYTEGEDGSHLYQMKTRPANQRDKLHENTLRTHHYLMLYEELSYAMNEGDIGRVESVFAPWILIFRAVGKHKYANRMLLFMHQLYEVYPEGLR